jgi:hypothetical protein
LAHAAYDSDAFKTFLKNRETTPVIKQNPTRKNFHPFSKEAYKGGISSNGPSLASKIGDA